MAETLFDRGIELMEQEKFDRACPYLEESYRRDPLLGALIALADCENERGRVATALKRYQEYVGRHENLAGAARQKQGSRLREASAKVDELMSAVPTLKITVPGEAKIPILHLDGIRIKPDVSYPVDPGKYEVTLDVFGRETSRVKLEARKGQKKIVAMDVGKTLPPQVSKRKTNVPQEAEEFDVAADDLQRQIWIGLGTVELVGITVIGLVALRPLVVDGSNAPSAGFRTTSTSPLKESPSDTLPTAWIPLAIASTGAIALATGGILWATQSHRPKPRPNVSLVPLLNIGRTPERPTFFGVQGRF